MHSSHHINTHQLSGFFGEVRSHHVKAASMALISNVVCDGVPTKIDIIDTHTQRLIAIMMMMKME